jgi:hypothetical protein
VKKLLVVTVQLISSMAFCQSNENGTIQLGAGTWLTLGDAAIKSTFDNSAEVKGSGVGVKINAGIKAQYGISERVSAGVFIRRELAIYSTSYSYNNTFFTPAATDITTAGFSFGAEAKYYLINKNLYNLHVGPSVGFYIGNATLKVYNAKGNLNGLNYGLGGGINWYWGYNVGMSFDFALNGQSLSGSPDNPSEFIGYPETVTKYKVTGAGIYIGLAFIIKFDRDLKNPIM